MPHKKFPEKKFNALGRGLDALISTDDINPQGSSSINEIDIDKIVANPNQPRREMDPESLRELADSIEQIGIVQPITLRQMDDGTYQIIAGERRWRASQLAGLATIPAYVRNANDESVALMALVENIQREDLNAIEIALAYSNMQQVMNLTQEAVAEKVGKKHCCQLSEAAETARPRAACTAQQADRPRTCASHSQCSESCTAGEAV